MPAPHINDELLDQYALATLPEEHLAVVEEHLLSCESCQSRLEASDEFAMLFRVAAVQPDARPKRGWRLFWDPRLWSQSRASWTVAAAAAALAVLLLVVGPLRTPPTATVIMQSLRGPDAPAQIAAGRPALLVFDIVPAGGVNDYAARIVNPLGVEILAADASLKNGHLAVLIDRLPAGSYWVRILRTSEREPIAEYGLQAK